MKLYSTRIIVYDMAELEQNTPAVVLTPQELLSFRAKSTITGAGYSSCTAEYTDRDGRVMEYTASTKGATAKAYRHKTRLTSMAEAQRVAAAKLRELNMGETTFSCGLPGDTRLAAGMVAALKGFWNFDGNYLIDSASHKVGGGYTTDLTLHKVVEL